MALSVASSGAGQPPRKSPGGLGPWITTPALAWEFLRRNPLYRAAFEQWRRERREPLAPIDQRWGLRFAADPRLAAEEARVFWLPDVAPGIVLRLAPQPSDPRARAARPLPLGLRVRADDGIHLRTAWGLQMLIDGGQQADAPLFVALAYDEHLRLRVRAVEALERLTEGRTPPESHLTPMQRTRLHRCLVALDGALAGRNYRAISEELFGPSSSPSEPWKTAAIRATTIRLVRAGKALMNGGYLKLLRGGL